MSSSRDRCVRSFPRLRGVSPCQISLSPFLSFSVLGRFLAVSTLRFGNDFVGNLLGHFFVVCKMHRVCLTSLRSRTHVRGVSKHGRQRNQGLDNLRSRPSLYS